MSLFDFKRLLVGSREDSVGGGAGGLLMGENFPWAVEKCMEWPPSLLPVESQWAEKMEKSAVKCIGTWISPVQVIITHSKVQLLIAVL